MTCHVDGCRPYLYRAGCVVFRHEKWVAVDGRRPRPALAQRAQRELAKAKRQVEWDSEDLDDRVKAARQRAVAEASGKVETLEARCEELGSTTSFLHFQWALIVSDYIPATHYIEAALTCL